MALKNWPLNAVVVNTVTDLVSPAANKEVALVNFLLCNYGATSANILITLTDSTGATTKGTICKITLAAGEPYFLDSKMFLAASAIPDKIRVLSDLAAVSFIANGDES